MVKQASVDSTLSNVRDPLANYGPECRPLLPYRCRVGELHRGAILCEPLEKTCRIVDRKPVRADVSDLGSKVKNHLYAVAGAKMNRREVLAAREAGSVPLDPFSDVRACAKNDRAHGLYLGLERMIQVAHELVDGTVAIVGLIFLRGHDLPIQPSADRSASSLFLETTEQISGFLELRLAEHSNSGPTKAGSRHAGVGNSSASETAVVGVASAAGRAALLQDGNTNVLCQCVGERNLCAPDEVFRDIATGVVENPGLAIEDALTTCSSGDLGRWTRYRQATGDLRTDGHHTAFAEPSLHYLMIAELVTTVVADRLTDKTCADENVFHYLALGS